MTGASRDSVRTLRSQVVALEQLLEVQERSVIEQAERLEREGRELYRTIFEYSNDAILVSDPAHDQILDANPKACELLGYDQDELLSMPLSDIHPNDLPALQVFARSVVERGVGWTDELACVTKSGVDVHTEISASSVDITGRTCIIALFRDISERKEAEEAMQELAVVRERNRLARELHDSVTQAIYSLSLFAEADLMSAKGADSTPRRDHLEEISQTAQQALKEMRLLVYELGSADLVADGLVGALQRRLDAVESRAGVSARLLLDELPAVSQAVERELYRVGQEALNNALKHSSASNVTVRIGSVDGRVVLEIEDDGNGFEVDGVVGSGGMGLTNMSERMDELGGTLDIISNSEGTTIRAVASAG